MLLSNVKTDQLLIIVIVDLKSSQNQITISAFPYERDLASLPLLRNEDNEKKDRAAGSEPCLASVLTKQSCLYKQWTAGGGGLQSCRKTKENNGACPKSAVNVNKNMLFDPQFGYLGLES